MAESSTGTVPNNSNENHLKYVRAAVVRRLVSVVREVCCFYSTAVPPIKSKLL